ncbi:hypothetical protein K439DRAFT_572236 [Ramaria rubella]|nr:hypothetical protein K439DRAFT_572236 [Ramaria rubella]
MASNPMRQFYTCYKQRDDPDRCKFFKWLDELPKEAPSMPVLSAPKTPAKHKREFEKTTPSTPNVSPSKVAINTSTTRSNFKPSVEIDEDENITSVSSDDEISQVLRGIDDPETPAKKFKFYTADGAGDVSRSYSPTKKPMQRINQWDTTRDDPENPFHTPGAPLSSTQTSKQVLPSSPATVSVTGDSVTQALNTLSSVPDAIRKLERKLVAAEKARDARSGRIFKLEREVQDLKNRNRTLEEAMEALKARGRQKA